MIRHRRSRRKPSAQVDHLDRMTAGAQHAGQVGQHARRVLCAGGHPVEMIDLGGGFPPAPAVADHARSVATALRAGGFDGTLLLEPGRAVVADAVDLVFTVVAVKTLADGSRCLVCDAGTNFLPAALTVPPWIEALDARGPLSPALVTGPLCLNVDVINPRALLPELTPGARLVARSVGAYQQSAATEFGEMPPPVTVRNRVAQPVTV